MAHWRTFLDGEARASRYLPWREVARATGLSRTTAWRLQKRDDFPAPYAISPGRVGYREDEVEAWCVSRGHSDAREAPRPGIRGSGSSAGASAKPAACVSRPPAGADELRQPRAAAEPPRGAPPVSARSPRRRRSQHAKAIAQQMRFDF